jgi:hypothetical protein
MRGCCTLPCLESFDGTPEFVSMDFDARMRELLGVQYGEWRQGLLNVDRFVDSPRGLERGFGYNVDNRLREDTVSQLQQDLPSAAPSLTHELPSSTQLHQISILLDHPFFSHATNSHPTSIRVASFWRTFVHSRATFSDSTSSY